MAIGASLGSTSCERNEGMLALQKTSFIGCRYGYMRWNPESPYFDKAGASGVAVMDYQDAILVNLVGERFFDETVHMAPNEPQYGRVMYDYFAAALSSAVVEVNGAKKRVGGPIWAIFDQDAAKREGWDLRPPFVDVANGYFFSGDTLAELARKLTRNPYQKFPMPPRALQETVTKYNSYVDMGKDPEFNKPTPKYKIQTPPFYAAWATPILHDTYAGLRVNGKFQVIDVFGKVIPSLYCAGESAAGITLHGLGRCIAGGYIAGKNAAAELCRLKERRDGEAVIVAIMLVFWSSGLAGQSSLPLVARASASVQRPADAAKEIRLGDDQIRLADAAPKGSAQRRRRLEVAAAHYRKAANGTSNFELAERALEALVKLYDVDHLNLPERMEHVWQELIALRMGLISLAGR